LFAHQIAREIHIERQQEIELRLRFRSNDPTPVARRSVRQHVGRGLIQIGSMLASDGPLQLAARR
jgi:hypothetical protein